MPTLYWNQTTNLVTTAPYDTSAAQITAARGSLDLRVVCQSGDVESGESVLLEASLLVGLVVRDPANFDVAGYLAGPTIFTRGASAADGYIATTDTDTTTTRQIVGAGVAGGNETLEYPARAALYFEPVGGGKPIISQPFDWTITAPDYQTGTPPADIVETWPSPAQLNAAVALAAGGIHNGDSPTFAALTVSGAASFSGPVSFAADEQILQNGQSIPWAVFATNQDSILAPITPTNGQSVRLRADGNAWETFTAEDTSKKGQANGYAPLDSNAKVPVANVPTLAALGAEAAANKGAASGYAGLDANSRVPVANLPGAAALGGEVAANKGQANGYAPLDGSAKVPAANLPSYVDDVLEFANLAALPATGESGKIYVTLDTNFEYRWSGSTYIRLVASPGTTDALVEGSTNQYFTAARALAATAGAYLAPNGSGAGLSGVAPFIAVDGTLGGAFGNGTVLSYASGMSVWYGTAPIPFYCSDTFGVFGVHLSDTYANGAFLATVTFANANALSSGAPLDIEVKARYLRGGNLQFNLANQSGGANYASLYFDEVVVTHTLASTSISFYLENQITGAAGSISINLAVEYRIRKLAA